MTTLFSPLRINNLTIPNRLVMPPMALDLASEKGEVTSKLIEHYVHRAQAHPNPHSPGKRNGETATRAGIGLIIVEHTYVNPSVKAHPRQLGIDDDSLIPGLEKLVEAIHKMGVPIGLQISHSGARALETPTAPSSLVSPYLRRFGKEISDTLEIPVELSIEDINLIIKDFSAAAHRAKEAGFDLIEIHGAHGYLLNEFFSPLTNKRQDQYGGSFENRLRLPLEVITAVKKVVGEELPVFYRLGADDRILGGIGLEDSLRAVPYFVEAGVDCLDISGGICGYLKEGPEGFFTYLSKEIKRISSVPVLVTGGITQASSAHQIITEQSADLVGVGRAMLKDPDWAKKALCLTESVAKES
jgi:NADPH2 dehydrogenase